MPYSRRVSRTGSPAAVSVRASGIERPVLEAQHARGCARPREMRDAAAPTTRAMQLVQVEGLRQVVVGAQLQQRHLVGGVGAGRHHDDGGVAARADGAHQFFARRSRQHEVGDDQIERRLALGCSPSSAEAVPRCPRTPARRRSPSSLREAATTSLMSTSSSMTSMRAESSMRSLYLKEKRRGRGFDARVRVRYDGGPGGRGARPVRTSKGLSHDDSSQPISSTHSARPTSRPPWRAAIS